MRTRDEIIQMFINQGYDLKYKDGNRFTHLFKPFDNDETPVDGADELQIGRSIEICSNKVISKAYMKRGYLWSGSAVTTQRRGNVYAIGVVRVIGTYQN